jgi:hypothetical protein
VLYHIPKRALKRQLLDESKRTSDPRVVDDGQFSETPPHVWAG